MNYELVIAIGYGRNATIDVDLHCYVVLDKHILVVLTLRAVFSYWVPSVEDRIDSYITYVTLIWFGLVLRRRIHA